MHKKLVAIAVAAVMTPAAMAETTLYGSVHMDIRSDDTNRSVNSNGSKLGIKGFENLGDGLKAIFQYEMHYTGTDSSTAIDAALDSFVGLQGNFGAFLVGRHNTPAKVAYYLAGNDHMDDTIADFNEVGFTEVRANNAIAYMPPKVSGFQFALAVAPGEGDDEDGLVDNYSTGLTYESGGLRFSAGYESLADTNNGMEANKDNKMFQLGGSYRVGNLTVGAQYEDTKNHKAHRNNADDHDSADVTVWGIAAQAEFGNNTFVTNYGIKDVNITWDQAPESNVEIRTLSLGVKHAFGKRTTAYVAYRNQEKPENTEDVIALGMIHVF